jgi:hypothetical protein
MALAITAHSERTLKTPFKRSFTRTSVGATSDHQAAGARRFGDLARVSSHAAQLATEP